MQRQNLDAYTAPANTINRRQSNLKSLPFNFPVSHVFHLAKRVRAVINGQRFFELKTFHVGISIYTQQRNATQRKQT